MVITEELKCPFCGRSCQSKRSLASHRTLCKSNPNRKKSAFENPEVNSRRKKSNQFIKAKEEGRALRVSNETRTKISQSLIAGNYKLSDSHKKILSDSAKRNNLGGVTPSKRIYYNGAVLGSTYELTLAIDLDKNNIRWKVCDRIQYIDPAGKQRTYTPDFYLIDYDVYLDPKNDFLINNINPSLGFSDVEKIEIVKSQHGINIIILDKTQLTWAAVLEKINATVTQ